MGLNNINYWLIIAYKKVKPSISFADAIAEFSCEPSITNHMQGFLFEDFLRRIDAPKNAPIDAPKNKQIDIEDIKLLDMLSTGISNREAARRLGISEATVRRKLKKING